MARWQFEHAIPSCRTEEAQFVGLFDMHGNVYEWCEDLWHSTYDGAPADGAPWLKGGYLDVRVFRGGGWRSEGGLDSASRSPSFQDTLIVERQGLRVVLRDF